MTRRAAVVGAAGQLGRSVRASFRDHGWQVLAVDRSRLDITRASDHSFVADWGPDVVVNCAAWTNVDGCAKDPEKANLINGLAPGALARACAPARFVQISTNEVFDGDQSGMYAEGDEPNPINAYGRSKLLGEATVRSAGAPWTVVRTAWLFGPGGSNFVTKIKRAASAAAERGDPLRVVSDEWGNPTWTPSLSGALVELLGRRDEPPEILHLAGEPPATRFGWAKEVVQLASLEVSLAPISSGEYVRDSVPPLRALLAMDLARSLGIGELEWRTPLADYVHTL